MGRQITPHIFKSAVKYYIRQLLKNPAMATLNDTLVAMGLKNPDFRRKLEDAAIIQTVESIKKNDSTGKDNFVMQIKVLDKDINVIDEKIGRLYHELFPNMNESVFKEEDKMKSDILNDKLSGKDYKTRGGIKLNEDGEGVCGDGGCNAAGDGATTTFGDGSGQYTTPFIGNKKKKGTDVLSRGPISVMVNERQAKLLEEYILKEEAEMGTAFGDFGYDDPGADTSNDKFWGKAKNHKNMLKDPNLS